MPDRGVTTGEFGVGGCDQATAGDRQHDLVREDAEYGKGYARCRLIVEPQKASGYPENRQRNEARKETDDGKCEKVAVLLDHRPRLGGEETTLTPRATRHDREASTRTRIGGQNR